ncbi:MAG TPA: histidine ammonia-lyase [Firmicutes bacterium]|nr:histidine ammonia-lyase [Bacillota bacterium]HBG44067.1 histidine ammonia-lyase [Bacillota bacterium]
MMNITINGTGLTLADVIAVAYHQKRVTIADEAWAKVERARAFVEQIIAENRVVYGITTGFGKFSEVSISADATEELQRNLIRSHACGVGQPFPAEVVRTIMLLRANALVQGHSGVRRATLELLLDMLNNDIHPVIPEQGSVGASGDLCPLAHLVLVMIGEGQAETGGQVMDGGAALARHGLKPISLGAKEGLALINGTQMMNAVGALALHKAQLLAKTADIAAALSWEGLRGTDAAYDAKVHALRPHAGQSKVASNMRRLVAGSAIRQSHLNCPKVQDAYSLRCVPQVHGAGRDALSYVAHVINTEMNSVTDNPLLFPEQGEVISGGNFHGQPLALALDFLGIALSEWANISERRTERLVNPALSGLPAFLTAGGGLNSGMMIAQYTAAALVSENKVLAHPACVDSIPTSANQEDHVSMGSIAARKAAQIAEHLASVLAIEVMAACQGIEFCRPHQPGAGTGAAYQAVRAEVAPLMEDRPLYTDIAKLTNLVASGRLLQAVEDAIGALD